MQGRFRDGAIAIDPAIRESTSVVAEATTLKVLYTSGSKRKIEAKDDYKRRTQGGSPDDWDALVLAFADSAAPYRGLMSYYKAARSGTLPPPVAPAPEDGLPPPSSGAS